MGLRPLCIDLDRTLVREDVFQRALLSWILRGFRPWTNFPPVNRNGLKRWIYQNTKLLSVEWHFNEEVISLICQARRDLRQVILVTGNSKEAGNFFAEKIPCFSSVLTSTDNLTLKGERKALVLQNLFGVNNFDYVGDSKRDIPVWEVSYQAYILKYQKRTYQKIVRKLLGKKPLPILLGSRGTKFEDLTCALVSENREGTEFGCTCLE